MIVPLFKNSHSFITKYYLNPRTVANESLFLIFLYFFSTPKVRLSSIEHKACIICSDETPTYFIVVSMLSCPNSFCICAKFTPSSNQWVARACRKLWQWKSTGISSSPWDAILTYIFNRLLIASQVIFLFAWPYMGKNTKSEGNGFAGWNNFT